MQYQYLYHKDTKKEEKYVEPQREQRKRFLAILTDKTGGFGEIDAISAARSGKAAGMVGVMSDAKIAIKMLSPHKIKSKTIEPQRRRERREKSN